MLVFDVGGIGSSSERLALKRRLAAILAADVVGYSRLMELDETGTLTVLRAYREDIIYPLIAEYTAGSLSSWATAHWWNSRAWSKRCSAPGRPQRESATRQAP